MSESILVVKTGLLAGIISGKNGLIRGRDAEILDIVNEHHEFRPRPEMEEDPSYRQIIPYVVLTLGEEVFLLRRLKKGGEKRLHGLLSIGVGGHINPVDEAGRGEALMRGLRREVAVFDDQLRHVVEQHVTLPFRAELLQRLPQFRQIAACQFHRPSLAGLQLFQLPVVRHPYCLRSRGSQARCGSRPCACRPTGV